ncbi:MAG TPA: tetratricopeptide repeat protein [Candidatus Sulfotelmatobacter sp.]|nr:tetratricopeptide repeat protein [Candidatus Sulfotelmatobacter sp.]
MREKTLNDVSPDCSGLYQSARAASARDDLDSAITLFNQALAREPGFVECREALRKAQLARFQNKNGFAHAVDEVREVPELAEAQIYLWSRPIKAIWAAEQVLNRVPTNALAHKIVAAAALKSGMYRTAFLSIDFIRNHGGRDNMDVNLELADALAESGKTSEGLTICGRLLKEYPENPRVTRTLARLSSLAFHEHDYPERPARTSSGFHSCSARRYSPGRSSGKDSAEQVHPDRF